MSRRTGGFATVLVVALALLSSCSSTSDPSSGPDTTGTTAARAAVRPDGPAADLGEELTGGAGVFVATSATTDLESVSWTESEHVAAGTAVSYAGGPIPGDGMASLSPDQSADYRTRVLIRRPADPADANGTVVVEWLNVSAGMDSGPDWTFLADELVRTGTAWVGVSAQHIGIEGGEVAVASGSEQAGKGLKGIDADRYGSLSHPGDAFSYDIYTQVARALRDGGADGVLGFAPEEVLAIGESQSAFALTTYANGVQPLAGAYDGFLIHSRGGSAMPLGEPGEALSMTNAIFGDPVTIRTDLDVPVMIVESETDVTSVIGYHPARQDDSEMIRLWEMAGTAHADAFIAGQVPCGAPINDGPQRFVVRAALRSLDTWTRTGRAPTEAPRLEVDASSGSPVMVRDADRNTLGGVRLPQVEAPVATLSGEPGPAGGTICMLLGSTVPFGAERLAELYPSAEEYLDAYEAATDAAIAAGFALEDDREQILADADPSAVGG